MTSLSEHSILRRRLQVTHEMQHENQLAIFDDTKSELVMLNATGGAMWTLLDGKTSLGEIARDMAEAIQNAPPQAAVLESLLGFAEELVARGAVEVLAK